MWFTASSSCWGQAVNSDLGGGGMGGAVEHDEAGLHRHREANEWVIAFIAPGWSVKSSQKSSFSSWTCLRKNEWLLCENEHNRVNTWEKSQHHKPTLTLYPTAVLKSFKLCCPATLLVQYCLYCSSTLVSIKPWNNAMLWFCWMLSLPLNSFVFACCSWQVNQIRDVKIKWCNTPCGAWTNKLYVIVLCRQEPLDNTHSTDWLLIWNID